MTFAVLRVRSPRKKQKKTEDTLKMLRLNKINHCTVVPETPAYQGMLNKVKDLITWGEVDGDTIVQLLEHSSDLDVETMEKEINDQTSYEDIEEFAEAVSNGEITIDGLNGLDNIFRMHPPEGGYEGVKKPYKTGGTLGYRGRNINDLLKKMLGPDVSQDTSEEG